ncbi:MAG: hypothetical protein JXA21_19200 [Anaerolineae bacterium]|nr:hypothetical protein [Anaerolineae bacterium]
MLGLDDLAVNQCLDENRGLARQKVNGRVFAGGTPPTNTPVAKIKGAFFPCGYPRTKKHILFTFRRVSGGLFSREWKRKREEEISPPDQPNSLGLSGFAIFTFLIILLFQFWRGEDARVGKDGRIVFGGSLTGDILSAGKGQCYAIH